MFDTMIDPRAASFSRPLPHQIQYHPIMTQVDHHTHGTPPCDYHPLSRVPSKQRRSTKGSQLRESFNKQGRRTILQEPVGEEQMLAAGNQTIPPPIAAGNQTIPPRQTSQTSQNLLSGDFVYDKRKLPVIQKRVVKELKHDAFASCYKPEVLSYALKVY